MFGQQTSPRSQGDPAIVRFAMLNEIIAADLWSQMADIVAANTAMRTAFGNVDLCCGESSQRSLEMSAAMRNS